MALPAFLSRTLTRVRGGGAAVARSVTDGGWVIPSNWAANWWQQGYDPVPSGRSAIVEACISAYAQTIAMCPGTHWRVQADGGRERVANSALSRILRKPNSYQGMSDFLLNLVHQLYSEGNAYAVGLRNNRFEFGEIHLMDARHSYPRVASTGEVFYSLAGNEVVERMVASSGASSTLLNYVPARDVLHVRLKTPIHPLQGVSPLVAAMIDEATSNAMARQAYAFYTNQSRPSAVLQTDLPLTKEQATELRERWNDQSQGLNSGGVPILSSGLKLTGIATTARDAQLAEIMGYTDKRIASVFRVPLSLLNLGDGTGPQGSTESLMQFWVATGLGFAINHIEEAFGRSFGLGGLPDDYLEFDTAALLRSAFKDRIEGFARGVLGGIFSPNEARAEFELPEVEFGEEPRVQQQVVPLSAWELALTGGSTPSQPMPPSPPAAPPNPDGTDPTDPADPADPSAAENQGKMQAIVMGALLRQELLGAKLAA